MGWLALCERKQGELPKAPLGSENLSRASLSNSGYLPATALSSRETLGVLQGQAVVARLCEAFPCITAFSRAECPDYRIDASKRE